MLKYSWFLIALPASVLVSCERQQVQRQSRKGRAVGAQPVPGSASPRSDWKKVAEAKETIPIGASEAQVKAQFGEPSLVMPGEWWYYETRGEEGAAKELLFQGDYVAYWTLHNISIVAERYPSGVTKAQIQGLLGKPVRTEPGASWKYYGTGARRAEAYIYFKSGQVVRAESYWTPHER